jgi:hypothetical protein
LFLSSFDRGRLLDLSWNNISVVHMSQKKNIKEVSSCSALCTSTSLLANHVGLLTGASHPMLQTLKALNNLQIVSFAYNNIGDIGLELCLEACVLQKGIKVCNLHQGILAAYICN